MTAKLKHLEIAGRDGNALEEFYAKLFGWKIERQNPGGFDYGMIPSGEAGDLTIGIRHEPEGESQVIFYVEVENVASAVAQATSIGAVVHIDTKSYEEKTFAVIKDPEGNFVGLLQKT